MAKRRTKYRCPSKRTIGNICKKNPRSKKCKILKRKCY